MNYLSRQMVRWEILITIIESSTVQYNKTIYWRNFYWWQQKERIIKSRLKKLTHTSTAGPLNLEENSWRVSPSQRRNPHTSQEGTWSGFSTLGMLRFAHSHGKSHQFGQTPPHLSDLSQLKVATFTGRKALPKQQELNKTFGMSW